MLKLKELLEEKRPETNSSEALVTYFNMWMHIDELFDFYVYGPLGGIAAQLFMSPQGITSNLPASAQLQRDFLSLRNARRTNGWHIDRTECQNGDQPSRYLDTALPRLTVPLISSPVRGTQILNQSMYAEAMAAKERDTYLKGESPYRREGRFEPLFGYDAALELPILPGINVTKEMVMEQKLDVGDVVIFNTCLWHRSPPLSTPDGHELALQPTFAPSSHVNQMPPAFTDAGGSWCQSDLGGRAIGTGSPCYPFAYPKEKRLPKGSKVHLRKQPTPKLRHLIPSLIKTYVTDGLRSLWFR